MTWPFDQAPNVAAITTRQVLEAVELDKSLLELFVLPLGWVARRTALGQPWSTAAGDDF
jgi:hypothetical protein